MAKKTTTARKPKATSAPAPAPVVADRPLSQMEKEFINKHYVQDKLTPDDLYKKLPGVDRAAIDAEIAHSLPPMKQGQTTNDRQQQLGAVQGGAGQFMGRDPSRGVAVMTEAAAELADARRVMAVPSVDSMARAQADKIHIIDPSKRAR